MLSAMVVGAIFVYSSYHVVQFVKRSTTKGKCGTCALKDNCTSSCSIKQN